MKSIIVVKDHEIEITVNGVTITLMEYSGSPVDKPQKFGVQIDVKGDLEPHINLVEPDDGVTRSIYLPVSPHFGKTVLALRKLYSIYLGVVEGAENIGTFDQFVKINCTLCGRPTVYEDARHFNIDLIDPPLTIRKAVE